VGNATCLLWVHLGACTTNVGLDKSQPPFVGAELFGDGDGINEFT